MKAEILLHTMLAQGGIKALDEKTKTDIKIIDDLKNFLNISL